MEPLKLSRCRNVLSEICALEDKSGCSEDTCLG